MKKFCYLLSIAGHALALLIALSADFPITVVPAPPRVVTVTIAEPPLPFPVNGFPAKAAEDGSFPSMIACEGAPFPRGAKNRTNTASRGAPRFPAMGGFSLKGAAPGSFRLAPVGKSPDPWAVPIGPALSPQGTGLLGGAFPSPIASPGRAETAGSVFLLPFDIREKATAGWTAAVLERIERHWIVSMSARVAFTGRVQITLTIGKDGNRRALVVDDSTLPASLTRAALQAVEASLPLPPLPATIAGESFAFTFVFDHNG